MKTKLILVGGFLGSGKTTLLHASASILQGEGKNAGLITNDQADQLVDTIYLRQSTEAVREVSGSCFCCNFNGFADACRSLQDAYQAEIILAEPVGSCTDLSATILQPVKEYYSDSLDLAPFTVLTDPVRLRAVLDGNVTGIHPSAAYILEKQIEEADIILISKKDTLTEAECSALIENASSKYPDKKVLACSSYTGEGITPWLSLVSSMYGSGQTITSVDYDTYAEGEACLGWLNATVNLSGNVDWSLFLKDLLTDVKKALADSGHEIGHIKAMICYEENQILGNITGTSSEVSIRGEGFSSEHAVLTFNARAEIGKDALTQLVEEKIQAAAKQHQAEASIEELRCLIPGRPNPTYRFDHIVE